jgi:hypothetical protein
MVVRFRPPTEQTRPSIEGLAVRAAATLLIALVVAACQSTAPSPGTPMPATTSPSSGAPVSSGTVTAPPVGLATHTPSSPPTKATLHVTQCATTSGGGAVPTAQPSQVVTIPTNLQSRLGLYGDGYHLVMAPSGWHCEAGLATDGNSEVRISSPNDKSALVAQDWYPACYSCVLSAACAVFATAAGLEAADSGNCDSPRPADERLHAETANTISFIDPPGVSGTGIGSGGPYESSGVVFFTTEGQAPSSANMSCTLAPADQDLCGPILDFFRSSVPAPAPGSPPAAIAEPPVPNCAVRLVGHDATVVIRGSGASDCETAKHDLLGIGVFVPVPPVPIALQDGNLLCKGNVQGISGTVEVWDSGAAPDGTKVCQLWNLVSP